MAAILAGEALALVGYFGLTSAEVTSLRYVLYPFVWIDVGLWAVTKTTISRSPRPPVWIAFCFATTYFITLAFLGGLLGFAHHGHGHGHVAGLYITMASPGWGPRVAYIHPGLGYVYLVPYLLVGYLSLAYLVYAAVLDATRAALGGAFGFVSCLSCSVPLAASLAMGAGGASLAMGLGGLTVDLSTVAFVLAVGLLYWRPEGRT
uniref:DUF7546 family protein n=1 Tax=Halegenticoccus tardaugens TaxID=2071624 RepID=UPI00100BC564|nr:hypothetical protein [Halegenticoccus tardaugens]